MSFKVPLPKAVVHILPLRFICWYKKRTRVSQIVGHPRKNSHLAVAIFPQTFFPARARLMDNHHDIRIIIDLIGVSASNHYLYKSPFQNAILDTTFWKVLGILETRTKGSPGAIQGFFVTTQCGHFQGTPTGAELRSGCGWAAFACWTRLSRTSV